MCSLLLYHCIHTQELIWYHSTQDSWHRVSIGELGENIIDHGVEGSDHGHGRGSNCWVTRHNHSWGRQQQTSGSSCGRCKSWITAGGWSDHSRGQQWRPWSWQQPFPWYPWWSQYKTLGSQVGLQGYVNRVSPQDKSWKLEPERGQPRVSLLSIIELLRRVAIGAAPFVEVKILVLLRLRMAP